MEEPTMQDLMRSVFITPNGKKLLEAMMDEYVLAPLPDDENQVRLNRLLGQRELVLEIFDNTTTKE